MQSFDLAAGLPRKATGNLVPDLASMDGAMYKIGRKTKRMTKRYGVLSRVSLPHVPPPFVPCPFWSDRCGSPTFLLLFTGGVVCF
jgi:hypothetical protein